MKQGPLQTVRGLDISSWTPACHVFVILCSCSSLKCCYFPSTLYSRCPTAVYILKNMKRMAKKQVTPETGCTFPSIQTHKTSYNGRHHHQIEVICCKGRLEVYMILILQAGWEPWLQKHLTKIMFSLFTAQMSVLLLIFVFKMYIDLQFSTVQMYIIRNPTSSNNIHVTAIKSWDIYWCYSAELCCFSKLFFCLIYYEK